MAFEDKTIICKDCGDAFLFSVGEQGFYLEKGLLNDPQRCPGCREQRRRERTSSARQATTIVCAECGEEATVPFVPRLNRPVYCADCFRTAETKVPA